MEIYRTYSYRLTKHDPGESVFRGVLEALRKLPGAERFDLRFCLEDSPHRKISACARVAKRFPALESFRFTDKSHNDDVFTVISNLPRGHAWSYRLTYLSNPDMQISTARISPEEILGVIRGIPRAFPFFHAQFAMDEVPALGGRPGRLPEPETPPVLNLYSPRPCPGITIASNWWTSRREVSLSITTAVAVAADGRSLIPPSPPVEGLLKQLGRVQTKRLTFYPTVAEARRATSVQDEAARRYDRSEPFYIERVTWPHRLPSEPQPMEGPPVAVAAKKTLNAAFKPRGYRRLSNESGLGGHVMVKRTRVGNLLELTVDTGTWSRSVSALWVFRSPLAQCVIPIQADAEHTAPQYKIGSDETLQKVVDNWAAVVDFLEQTAAPELDGLFGPTAEWFTVDM